MPPAMAEPIPDLGRSWWLRETLALPEFAGEPAPALAQDIHADVAILGGGYTGMWTAWFLTERDPGLDVVLVEQDVCGGGPSGRNGGFCDGWWGHVTDLVSTFGEGDARELLLHVGRSPLAIGEWCAANDVDAWFTVGGDLAVATNPAMEGRWTATMDAGAALGFAEEYRELDADQVRERCDSPLLRGGMLIPESATVHPARLARGLRNALMRRGVRIFEQTPVTRFGRGKAAGAPAVVETPSGSVRAGQAVIALGAWATPWKAFRQRLTIRGSAMVITAPAPEKLEALGWTGGEAIRDFRSSIHYLRTTPDGRIAFGLGGLQPDLARRIDRRYAFDRESCERVAADLRAWFPSFADVPIEAGWGGPINVSAWNLPYFGTLPPGNVHFGHGYTGNGVAPSHLGGTILAGLTLGDEGGPVRLPIVHREPPRFPPEPIRSAGMLVANRAIIRKDDREHEGGSADPATRLVATMPRRMGYNLGPKR
jgi:glycine/D-amino acid oxidase-like deaminating enzyme